MRFTISLLFALFISITGNAMDKTMVAESAAQVRLVPTIESEKVEQDTVNIFGQFRSEYQKTVISDSRGVLPPWGLVTQDAQARINTRKIQKSNGNYYLDQLAYKNDVPVAYVNLGVMPVKGYKASNHPLVAQVWYHLGLTNEDDQQKENTGVGYIAFGFANSIEQGTKEAVVKEALSFVKKAATDGKLLPIQNHVPTHLVSIVAFEDKSLIELLGKTGFTIYDILKDTGYPKFDSDTEQRARVLAVLKL